ncbi:MAG: T9SS type A sorting domain-containing protein, partial [Bacteroidota bacterium]
VVEASTDAKNFVAVGQLDGAGDAKTITSYRFIDKSPLAKRTYYRLQQIDIDGRISYSKIISVERKAQTRLQIRRIIPNPVAVDARLQFTAQTMQTVNYRIMNAAGELLLHDQIQPTIGNNEVPVATASLSAGIYFVILEQGEDRVSYRFVIK